MKFEMEDFRRFHKSGDVDIAPITVLVGENSSGKTSFLAGLRYILQSMSIGGEGTFNREPFFLGAYDQIAHYRGGRFGRSPQFALSLQLDADEINNFMDDSPSRYVIPNYSGSDQTATNGRVKLTFTDDQSQPNLSTFFIENDYVAISMQKQTIPSFRIQLKNKKSTLDVRNTDDSVVFSTPGSVLNRNSVGPFVQTIQYWSFTAGRRSAKTKPTAQESSIREDLSKSFLPIYLFSEKAIYASAPFRTKPERTYSPIEATSSAEGGHIPIMMAQAKAFERKKWTGIKEVLESFGARSGLFKKIDIKRLGRSDSDPFQIVVTVSKDRSNIMDVGYGVSQILPIIVETIMNEEARFFLFQQPEVHLHPRAQAELGSYFTDYAINNSKYFLLETHSDYIIDRIKTEIRGRQKDINKYLSVLYFERDEMETKIYRIMHDEDGNVINAPANYRTFFLDEAAKNLGF